MGKGQGGHKFHVMGKGWEACRSFTQAESREPAAGLGKTVQCIAFLAALLGKTGDPALDAAPPPAGAVRCADPHVR